MGRLNSWAAWQERPIAIICRRAYDYTGTCRTLFSFASNTTTTCRSSGTRKYPRLVSVVYVRFRSPITNRQFAGRTINTCHFSSWTMFPPCRSICDTYHNGAITITSYNVTRLVRRLERKISSRAPMLSYTPRTPPTIEE